ncbi:hypothetical protein BGX28_006163 [Mortierella sp. GBA30]|nr:hypothetical protein BGX28_006163 [Mortierella sp. GBA30]
MDKALSLLQQPQPVPVRQKPMPTTTSNHFLSLLFFQESTSLTTAALVDHDQFKNFQFLRKTFEAVLAGMVRDRNRYQLVILCPDQPSLMGTNALSRLEWEWGGIDEEFIMTTAKGFKILKQARLVSEKIFYDNEGRAWMVQYIDRPLVGISETAQSATSVITALRPDLSKGRPTSQVDTTAQKQNLDLIRAGRRCRKRFGPLSIAQHYRDPWRKGRSRPLLTLQTALQRFPGVSKKLEQYIMGFNDATMSQTSLEDIRTSLDHLLSDSVDLLNQIDTKVLSALLDEYEVTAATLDQLLENHIMNSTYDIVFFKIASELKQQDWYLAEAVRELRNLDLGQVGLPDMPQYYQCLVSALNEFQSLGLLRTPEEKLSCLVKSVRVTSALPGGADDLIPVLLLTVLRSGISNLASNLYYMKNFVLFGDASRGEYGYSLSTLEAVSRYILSHVKQLSQLSAKNQDYWEKICAGSLDDVKKFYSEPPISAESKTVPPPLPRRTSVASLASDSDASMSSTLLNSLVTSPVQSRDAEGNNGVLLASRSQQIGVLKYLLQEKGDSAAVSNYEGKTPLMFAADLANLEMVRLILQSLHIEDKDAIDHQDILGNSAMHICAAKGSVELLELLLPACPNLSLPNNEGDTPLIIAAKMSDKSERHGTIVSALAPKMMRQDLDRQNNNGDTALHFLVHPALITTLVNSGANPEVDNYAGWTPLLKWALHDDTTVVGCLLGTGRVDVLMTDSRGYTPLHMACLRGNLEMSRILQARTPVDLQSAVDGSTPLQLACQSSSVDVVDFLLQKGANPEMRDWANESPADMTNDNTILEKLDNAMLFWNKTMEEDSKGDKASSRTLAASGQPKVANRTGQSSLGPSGKRVIRVVRGTMGQDGKIRYIVKSGSNLDPSSIITMPRSLDDFRFLRENLLMEIPDACIPSLENFHSPFLLSPSRPSKAVLAISTRRLDMFLNYLSNHPVLANHELVWEFMLMPELQRDVISDRSRRKQESTIDSIYDNFAPAVDNLEHEETYFKYLNEEILKLETAVQHVRRCSRKLSRSAQDVPEQLDIFSEVLEQADQVCFDSKEEYIQALKEIASTQSMTHTSDIESLGNLFEDFSFVIDGTLKALKHPQEIIASIRQLRTAAWKAEQSIRRSDMWWSGLSTIGEGAMTVVGGAGAALGAVGHAATSTFEAVSGTKAHASGGDGGIQHTRSASESMVRTIPTGSDRSRLMPSFLSRSKAIPPLPSSMAQTTSSASHSPVTKVSSLVTSDRSNQTASSTLTPIQPQSRYIQESSVSSSPKSLSAASLLTTPFNSIAAVASAATGQPGMTIEEIRDTLGKSCSMLNSLRGSLFEELAHLQSHHAAELERAMRDFGARQMQIEKSRLRDMMEILNDLRVESHTQPAAADPDVGGLGTVSNSGSTRDVRSGQKSHAISRQPSIQAMNMGSRGLWGDGSGSFLDEVLDDDEKTDARAQQHQHYEQQQRQQRSVPSGHQQNCQDRDDEDALSEKIPFD